MWRKKVLVPSPTARDWKGTNALGALVKGTFPRILALPNFVAFVMEGLPPPTNGEGDEEGCLIELERLRRKWNEKEDVSLSDTSVEGLEGM